MKRKGLLFCLAMLVAMLPVAFFVASPVQGLTLRDAIELRVLACNAASRDIVPSTAAKDLRAAPSRLGFAITHSSGLSQPNNKGWVWCGIMIPGNTDTHVQY